MSDHDPLCSKSVYYDGVDVPCRCDLIAKARADERERIARAIEAMDAPAHTDWGGRRVALVDDAAAIARGGD